MAAPKPKKPDKDGVTIVVQPCVSDEDSALEIEAQEMLDLELRMRKYLSAKDYAKWKSSRAAFSIRLIRC